MEKIDKQNTDDTVSRNLLILCLSTGNLKDLQETFYSVPDSNGKIVTGGYQLEPVPQYLAATVGLDRVLMIETEMTANIEDYFKKCLINMGNIRDDLTIDEYRLTNPDKATLFDVDQIIALIKTYANENNKITIYLDIHGGLRSNAEIMTTIFSLLPMEQLENGTSIYIDPANIYSVVYDKFNMEKNKIFRAGEGYQLIDLVAGVHEFVEYGRTESLNRYANNHEYIKPMVKAMDTISDALAMANIDEFESGLKALKKEIKKKRKDRDSDNRDENTSDILIRLVDQEYGRIIDSKTKQLEKIRWCKDKKFYQLAITMCEAQIPCYLQKGGVFDFSNAIEHRFGQARRSLDDDGKFLDAFNFFVTSCGYPTTKGSKTYYHMQWRVPKGDNKFYYLECNNDISEMVDTFLQLHSNIKQTRNKANHLSSFDNADSVRAGRTLTVYSTTQQLDQAIEDYLDAVSRLKNAHKTLELKITDQPVW